MRFLKKFGNIAIGGTLAIGLTLGAAWLLSRSTNSPMQGL